MKIVTMYQACDGQSFETEAHCRAHEAKMAHLRLVGLTADDVQAAIARDNVELADAIEAVGTTIARARRAGGDLRRQRRGNGQAEPAPAAATAPGTESAMNETYRPDDE